MGAERLVRLFGAPAGPGWLVRHRRAGMERFAASGLPSMRDELWKYTSLAALAEIPFQLPGAPVGLTRDRLDRLVFGNLRESRLVFLDGILVRDLSSPDLGGAGVAVLAATGAPVPGFGLSEGAPFPDLNTALFVEGTRIRIPRGVALVRPLHLVFVSSGGAVPVLASPRVLIEAEEGARAEIVEAYVSMGPGVHLTNAVTETVLAPGASLAHIRIQEEGAQAHHLGRLEARLGPSSRLASHVVSIGAALSRHEIHVRLEGEGAACSLDGLYLAASGQHTDHVTVVDHARPGGRSDQVYKGILHGASRAVFYGKVVVRPDAQRTEAHQRNQNLLLSPEAEVDTRPQLQIDADDVACTHGATVGRLDPQAVFYLRSRGLETEAANSLLTLAFARELLDRIPLEAARVQLHSVLCAWLTRTLGRGIVS